MQATALPSTAEIHKAVSQPPGAKISLQIQSLIWLQRWYALFFEPPTPILTSAPRTQTSVVKKLSFGGLIDKFTLKVCLRQTSLELRHTVLVPADDPVAQLQNLTRVDARGIDLDASEVEMSMDLLRVKVPLSDSSVQEAYRLDETIDYFTRFDTLNFCTRAVGVRTRMFVQHIGSFGADGLQEAQKELMALLAQTNRTSAVKQMDALDDSQDTEDLFQSNTSLEHFSSFDVHREPCSAAVAFKRIVDPSDITEPSNEDFGGDLASRAGRHESFFFSASLINYRSPYVLHETQPVKPGNMSNTPNINATPANPWALMPFSGDVSRFSAIKPTGLFRQTTKNMFSPTSLLSAGSVFSEPPDFNLSHSSIPQHISSYSGKLNLPAPAVPTLAIASLNSKSKAGGQSLLERRKLGNNLTIPVSAAAAADSAAPNLFLPTPSPTFSSLESASSEKELEGPAEAHRWAVHDCHILWTVSIRAATLEWTTTWRDFLRQRSQHEAREQVEPLKAEVKRALRAKRQQNMSTDAETKVGHQAMDLSVLKILANRRSKFQSHRNSLNMQALRSTLHLQEEEAAPVAPAPEPIPEDTEFILPKSAAAEDISSKLTDVVPEHLTQTASSVLSYFTSVDSSARRRVLVPNSVDGSTFSTLPSAPMLRFLAESTTEDHLFSDDDGGGDLSQLTRSVRRNSLEDDEPLRRSPAQTPVHSAVKEPAKDTKQSVKKSNAAGDRDESLWQSFPLTNQQYIPASMEPTRYSYSEVDGKLHYDFNLEDPLKALERQHSDNAEQYQQLYFVEFTRPQINFQSAESNSRVVLASTTAYVQGGGCPVVEPQLNNESEPKLRRSLSDDFIHAQTLFGNLSSIAENISVPPMSATQSAQSRTSFRFPESPFENIPQSDHNVSFGSQISDKSPFLNSSVLQLPFASKSKPSCYKEEISTILFGTQLFVSPVDVDITAGLQWIPKHMFESGGDAVQSISDAQNIILRRIVEPCPVLFNYSYDVDVAHALLGDATLAALKLLSKPARRRVLQRFRRQLTHSTQLFVPTFVADTNPEQFQGLIDVINGVLLSNESKAADAEVDSGRKMTHKARRHMKKRAMESFQRQLGEKGRKPAQGDKITVDEVYGASQFTGDSDASDFDSSESDSGSDADDIDDREERDMARQHGRHSSLVLLDDDVPTLPESESELQALLEIGLKAKADAEKAIEEEMASDALDKLKLSGRSDSVRPAASTQSKVQRQVMSVVQYGLADARWTLRDVFGQVSAE
jgi:hypothetical protein